MKLKQVYFLSALFISGCVSSLPITSIPSHLKNVNFTDTDVFDKNILDSMSVDIQSIDVAMIGKVSVNHIPERLGKWLSVVNEDGQVILKSTPQENAKNEPQTTKSISAFLGLLPMVYGFFEKKLMYGAAEQYDATIFYQHGSGVIDKVVFTKKQ